MVRDLVGEMRKALPPARKVVTVATAMRVHPRDLEQIEPISALLDLGDVVVCCDVPVGAGGPENMDALVDNDAVAAHLAQLIGAELLVLATDVPGVYEGWGMTEAHLLRLIDLVDLGPGKLEAGSMRPKLEAAGRFARGGGRSVIGALADLEDLVEGRAGTQVVDSSALVGHARSAW